MKIIQNLIYLLILQTIILISCNRNYEYPLIQTGEVTDIDPTGAVFHAKITSTGSNDIIEYGFVWSLTENPDLNSSKFQIPGSPGEGAFSARISSDLIAGKTYYVKAYARNIAYVTYGKQVTFSSSGSLKQTITGFTPESGTSGTQVTITGNNFSEGLNGNIVKFGHAVAEIKEATLTRLVVVLPQDLLVSGKVYISVETAGVLIKSTDLFTLEGCNIIKVSPETTINGDDFKIKAENIVFDTTRFTVRVGGIPAQIYKVSGDSIYGFIPFNSRIGKNEISLTSEGKTCFSLDSILVKNPWKAVVNNLSWTSGPYASFQIGDLGFVLIENQVWKFRNGELKWSRCADLPDTSGGVVQAFAVGGKGYGCFGAINGTKIQTLYEYDPVTDVWIKKAEFPGLWRAGSVAVTINGKAYLGMGQADDGSIKNDFWEYDPNTDVWTRKADIPSGFTIYMVGIAVSDKGYFGLGSDQYIWPSSNEFWEYDHLSDTWRKLADFPGKPRIFSARFALNENCYMGTGWTDEYFGTNLSDFWRYDTNKNTWIRIADMIYGPRSRSLSYAFGNLAYICNGSYENQNMIEFDPN